MNTRNKKKKGFTLIELLVVIAIVAILAVVVVLTLNPSELLKQSRDAQRVSDFGTLKSAIGLYLVDAPSPNLASTTSGYSACYLSTITAKGTTTTTPACGVFTKTYSAGNSSTTSSTYRNNNGQGWLPVNFSQITYGSPLSALPVDPINNASYYYAYAATSTSGYYFELDAFMESVKYSAGGTNNVVTTDGGDNSSAYETGNFPGLNL